MDAPFDSPQHNKDSSSNALIGAMKLFFCFQELIEKKEGVLQGLKIDLLGHPHLFLFIFRLLSFCQVLPG